MKWKWQEPVLGDMIRVKLKSVYHYGVFVSDDEVIQFGLAPNMRQAVKDSDVEVCVSDIETFIQGSMLEVAVLDKKEKKTRIPAFLSVKKARERLGEKGYNILYNNCEHFAYECIFGAKKCTQADDVRAMFRNLPIVDVYVGEVAEKIALKEIAFKSRLEEISACKNERVQKQKYSAWKLLEFALNRSFGLSIKKINLEKNSFGKWISSDCFFSISHSDKAVVVAVSRGEVGVDVECDTDKAEKIKDKVFTALEREEYEQLDEGQKKRYFLEKWTQKESIFKKKGEGVFRPNEIETRDYKTSRKSITVGGKEYLVSVATDALERIRWYQDVNYIK
ncbi:MAG: 4'-phosphopantetheinyl transferase superfamily protein [Clostridiales bacterium]|nr:4'-phosphopantetheinyl transferase superfamily protein [Clostridiales bacterium]